MRSFLTSLSVVVSIASVVAIVALGQGAYNQIKKDITNRLGLNLITIKGVKSFKRGLTNGNKYSLNLADFEAIIRDCPNSIRISADIGDEGQVIYQNKNEKTFCSGITENYLEMWSWEISEGRNFTSSEITKGSKVCIIGKTVAENLFGDINPIGEKIRFKKIPLKIIGILKSKGNLETDDRIFVPFHVVQRCVLGVNYCHSLFISLINPEDEVFIKSEIEETLRRQHRLSKKEKNDFKIFNIVAMTNEFYEILSVIILFIGIIASISLIVGGTVVMNTMLVSVTERTAEIGIHMAIGAKDSDIMWQFLVESAILTCSGGVIGIVCGIELAQIIANLPIFIKFTESILATELITPIVSNTSIIISFVFSLFVGIFFGLYPAYKASQLDPIEALRYE
jgi:putative ABC transport system permease protein